MSIAKAPITLERTLKPTIISLNIFHIASSLSVSDKRIAKYKFSGCLFTVFLIYWKYTQHVGEYTEQMQKTLSIIKEASNRFFCVLEVPKTAF
jgi:hypothetical protein